MTRRQPPTAETFDKLLLLLDPDREKAQKKYQTIHTRLIGIFSTKKLNDPEDLADQVFDVAASKIDWLLENYQGDPALYLYGIARNIFFEQFKTKPVPPPPPPPPDNDELERRSNCLDKCLDQHTTPDERRMVLRYFEKEKKEKIQTRKQIARESGITINALRIKVSHILARLRPCLNDCLAVE